MRRILPLGGITLLLAAACTSGSKPNTENADEVTATDLLPDDTLGLDWTPTSVPMVICVSCDYDEETGQNKDFQPIHIYTGSEDSLLYTPIADTYSLMYNQEGRHAMRYQGKQEGKEMGSLISGKYAYCMSGLKYEVKAKEPSAGIAFNDEFLSCHEIVPATFPNSKAPKSLIDTLEARYGTKVQTSYTCALSEDKSIGVYSIQMKPKDDKCLGMRVVTNGDAIYVYEQWANNYDDEFTWHVDDGGEYYPLVPFAITRSEKGIDVFYNESAPESYGFDVLLQRGDSLTAYCLSNYYVYVDYCPTPDPVELPKEAKLAAELDGYKVWIKTDVEPTEEDDLGQYSVYYSKPNETEVYQILTTGENRNAMEKWNNQYENFIPKSDVLTAQEAFIVKEGDDDYWLLLQGCPDMRNLVTYALRLPLWNIEPFFGWPRSNGGFQGMDTENQLIKINHSSFIEEGGIQTVCRYYDFSWNIVKEEPVEE